MRYINPGSEEWAFYILEGLTEAAEKAIAEHEREGRGDMLRAMQPNPDGSLPPWPKKPDNPAH